MRRFPHATSPVAPLYSDNPDSRGACAGRGMLVALNVTHHGFGGVGATGGKSCTSGQDAFNLNNMPLLTYVA